MDKFTYEISTQQSYNGLHYLDNCEVGSSYICYDADDNTIDCENVDEVSYIECNEYDEDFALQIQSDLKLPFAGRRYYFNASLNLQGSYGFYWSSSPDSASSNNARYLYLDSSNVSADYNDGRAYGYSVRCFKDSYVAPISYTLTFDSQGGDEVAT